MITMNYDIINNPIQQKWNVSAGFFNRDNVWYGDDNHGLWYDTHTYFMDLTVEVLTPHYTCTRPPGAAGAIIVTESNVIFGPVGPPEYGMPTCKDVGCLMKEGHCVRTIHAERRCIHLAAMFGIPTRWSTCYSILKPCYECTKALISAGVTEIYYAGAAYDEEATQNLILRTGMTCEHIDVGLPYGNAPAQKEV